MQEIKVYDPQRNPAIWNQLMRPGQYAIFLQDAQNATPKLADGSYLIDGRESTCFVFDSLAEAEAYATEKVNQIRSLACLIYDHEGKGKDPLKTIVNESQRSCFNGTSTIQSDIGWGTVLIITGVLVIWFIEWLYDYSMTFGLVFGSKPLIFGFTRLISGINKYLRERNQIEANT